MAVWRKASLALVILRGQERERLLLALQWEHPNIILRFRSKHGVQKHPSIARPTRCIFVLPGFKKDNLVFRSVRQLLIQVVMTGPVGTEHDAAPIRRPERIPVARAKRKPCARAAAGEIHQPDAG